MGNNENGVHSRLQEVRLSKKLPTDMTEIHRRSLDERGRPFKGVALPSSLSELHALAAGTDMGGGRPA